MTEGFPAGRPVPDGDCDSIERFGGIAKDISPNYSGETNESSTVALVGIRRIGRRLGVLERLAKGACGVSDGDGCN